MMKKFTIVLCAILTINQMMAQNILKDIDISGSVDTYFRSNLYADFDLAPASSFANLPGFSLGMANIILRQNRDRIGFCADLVFGPRGTDAVFLSQNSSSIINQLYLTYALNEKITATLGNFNTFLGYEVISPSGNFNYSTSYLFSYGPFSHTGLKLDFEFNEKFALMVGLLNPTDFTEYNPFSKDYILGTQLAFTFEKGALYLNGIYNPNGADTLSAFTQYDVTFAWDLTEKVYLGVNASTASDLFSGASIYFQYAFTNEFKGGVRVEQFLDRNLGIVANNHMISDLTLSANIEKDKLMLIPEIRIDLFEDDIIPYKNEMNNTLLSFLVAAVYTF